MARYNCYIKQAVRQVPVVLDTDIDTAIVFLENEKYGVVTTTLGKQRTLEELKDAKNFGSKFGSKQDSGTSSFGEIYESSDTELSETSGDNSE